MNDRELIDRAIAARARAYCPYSRFPVGAALLAGSGEVYAGANVENAVNGLSVCAERVALMSAVAAGERTFTRIAVVCGRAPCAPCGACRQVLHEHAPDLVVLMEAPDGSFTKTTLRDLLPNAFAL